MRMTWAASGRDATLDEICACVGDGWRSLITDLVRDLDQLGWDGQIAQVKEKFGALRFYIGAGNDAIWNRIQVTEYESAKTCERCGSAGEIRGSGWLRCLCDKCQSGGEPPSP